MMMMTGNIPVGSSVNIPVGSCHLMMTNDWKVFTGPGPQYLYRLTAQRFRGRWSADRPMASP